MSRMCLALPLLTFALGCESEPTSDQIVPMDQVPPKVMEAARKELPGYTFDTAFKMKKQGKDAYEVRGKDKRGMVREVEGSPSGEVLGVEWASLTPPRCGWPVIFSRREPP
jgi:hypothetical protein